MANTIALCIEFKHMSIQEACDYVIHTRNKGEMGVIGITPAGEVGIAYNTKIMKRASINAEGVRFIAI